MDSSTQDVTEQTKIWVNEIVIGLNLCPFAARPFNDNTIDYIVARTDNKKPEIEQHLHQLADCFNRLDETASIATSLLIFPETYKQFDDYLELVHLANLLLEDLNYSGIYQLASFHPAYLFDDTTEDDASNFTNRSPYPMLHIIREIDLEKAIANYPGIEQVPENNIKKLRMIGYTEMQKRLSDISSGNTDLK
ncbi:MAG: DUF1415 domain-containing protein [Gammaproteobacteria bacterium]|nr:DUF1415 domain-containing protein [Gammaproteobacteria bacterium]